MGTIKCHTCKKEFNKLKPCNGFCKECRDDIGEIGLLIKEGKPLDEKQHRLLINTFNVALEQAGMEKIHI